MTTYFSKMLLILLATAAALSLIQDVSGATTSSEEESSLEKCCELGSSWAQQKLRCEKFTGPVSGVAPSDQPACMEAVEICCRKIFMENECDQGKADARAGIECTRSDTGPRRTPVGLGDFRHDCCEGCKLGLRTSLKGKGCSFKRLILGAPWDSAFSDCCNEPITSSTQSITSTKVTYTSTSITTPETDELDYEDITDATYNTSSSVDLCKIMKGLLCSDICVPTPGSYICKCYEGSKLQEDGRSCVSKTTTTIATSTTPLKKTTKPQLIKSTTKLTTPLITKTTKQQQKITKRSTQTTTKLTTKKSLTTSKKFTKTTESIKTTKLPDKKSKSRTTRSASSEDNELTSTPCPNGFRFNPASEDCDDIDECAENTHNCGAQKCYNLPGSFQCAKLPRPVLNRKTTVKSTTKSGPGYNCIKGYKYNKTLEDCTDIDECMELKDACSSNELCLNTHGSFQCNCLPGYRRDELTQACIDINECQLPNDCLSTQRCDNTIGSYTCVRFLPCGTGYTLNAVTEICEDDNECDLGTHDCREGYHCRNTLGSFRCDRNRPGGRYTTRKPNVWSTTVASYITARTTSSTTARPLMTKESRFSNATTVKPNFSIKMPVTTTWSPVYTNITPITTENVPTVGSLIPTVQTPNPRVKYAPRSRGSCPLGYESNIQGQCIDINECLRNLNMCGNQRCINSIGSFSCEPRINCGAGYTPDQATGKCIDVDECAEGTHKCGPRQTCENKLGGYVCYCPPGFEIGGNNSMECVDVNECTRVLSGRICGLPGNGKCVNTIGSYRCVCESGFENDPKTGGCIDKDECQNPNQCQHECYNTWGSYRCSCQYGYTLRSDNRTCEDIDECQRFKDNNLCVGICDNTPGSYACRCPDGYILGDDGRTCQDIDECVTKNVCTATGETCQNLRGSYRCNRINCPSGYIQDQQRKNRCVRENLFCSVHDKACFQRPAHYTYNYISIVSMYPIPVTTGQVELFTMRGSYNLPGSSVHFNLAFIRAMAPPHVKPATEDTFALRRPFASQAILVMTKSIQGPQDIELEFSMEIYGPNGDFAGSAIAKIYIIVTQYEF